MVVEVARDLDLFSLDDLLFFLLFLSLLVPLSALSMLLGLLLPYRFVISHGTSFILRVWRLGYLISNRLMVHPCHSYFIISQIAPLRILAGFKHRLVHVTFGFNVRSRSHVLEPLASSPEVVIALAQAFLFLVIFFLLDLLLARLWSLLEKGGLLLLWLLPLVYDLAT